MKKRWGNINPADTNRVRIDDLIDMVQLPKKKWLQVRFLDTDVLPVKMHWLNILAGKAEKAVQIPKYCIAFDPDSESDIENVTCPYCSLPEGVAKDQKFYLANAIIRDIQEDEPARKMSPSTKEKSSGFKDRESSTWTPVRVIRIPMSLAKKIQELAALNKVRNKKTGEVLSYDVSHDVFGADVNIKFDPDASGTDMYSVQLAERTKLTDAEKEYLIYELTSDLLDDCGRESEAQAMKECKRMNFNDLSLEEEEVTTKSKSGKNKFSDKQASSVKKPARQVEMSIDDEDEDEDEDVTPVTKKAAKPAAKPVANKRKPVVEEEDDDLDLDLDEDDEDVADEDEDEEAVVQAPSKKAAKPAAKPVANKRKPVVEDDEEEDDDVVDEDEDEDEDENQDDLDVEDDDDSSDDEDEEEEPVPVVKKPVKAAAKKPAPAKLPVKTAAKKQRPVTTPVSDDEDDDDVF